jgi:hypothetical protein
VRGVEFVLLLISTNTAHFFLVQCVCIYLREIVRERKIIVGC